MMHPVKEVFINKDVCINIVKNSLSSGCLSTAQLQSLHLLLELQVHNSSGTAKELLVQVTDESDPLLLLSTNITENGYQNLRTSQGLLVDFNSFPHHFSNLIKRCLEEQQKESPKMTGNEVPSSTDGGIGKISLEVVELNDFKHLCHLSLSLTTASVQTKLSHLSSYIKSLKSVLSIERDKAKQEVNCLTEEVEGLQAKISVKIKETEAVREEMQRRIDLEVEKYSNLLMQEKEMNLKTKSDYDRKGAREKRELEARLGEQNRELKSENNSLKKKNLELNAKSEWLENALREVKQKLKDCEDKLRRQNKDLNSIAKERSDLKRDCELKEDSIRKLSGQILQEENNIQEMDRIIKRNSNHLDVLNQEKASLQGNLDFCQKKLEKREESLRKLFLDFQKSLEIIKKFKQKIKDGEEEIYSLIETTRIREKVLEEREKNLKVAKEENELLSNKIVSKDTEFEETRKLLKEANEKLVEQESILRRNENVISWLNKHLNEIEATGVLLKRAPLAEAYIHPQNVRAKLSASTPTVTSALTTSTPLSAHSEPLNFISSAQSKIHSLSSVPPLNDIPKISEEISPQIEDNKENSEGLDPRYLKPTTKAKQQASLPVRGILRANAVNKLEGKNLPKKVHANIVAKPQGRTSTSKQSAYFKT